ncbi:MAG: tol-pal system YbgF family protein [Acidobacteriota bacterium]
MKKSERHQIKRNDLATVLEGAVSFFEEHRRAVLVAAAAVVIAAISALAVTHRLRSRQEEASVRLAELIRMRRAPIALSLDPQQRPVPGLPTFATVRERDLRVIELADAILEEYGSTRAAPKALYYRSIALADLERYEEAVASWDRFLREHPRDFLAPLARYNLGRVLEAQGSPGEALLHYQALADDARAGLFPTEEGLLGIARCQEALGEREAALETYRRVLDEFPGSEYQVEARRKVDELS